jgi:hypothetical protein
MKGGDMTYLPNRLTIEDFLDEDIAREVKDVNYPYSSHKIQVGDIVYGTRSPQWEWEVVAIRFNKADLRYDALLESRTLIGSTWSGNPSTYWAYGTNEEGIPVTRRIMLIRNLMKKHNYEGETNMATEYEISGDRVNIKLAGRWTSIGIEEVTELSDFLLSARVTLKQHRINFLQGFIDDYQGQIAELNKL